MYIKLAYFLFVSGMIGIIIARDIQRIKTRTQKYKIAILWRRFINEETLSVL